MIEITFRDTSEKLWPAACSTFGGPRVARLVESRPQLGQSGVPHQHQEPLLGKIAGLGRVESGRSVLDRIHPVTGDGLSDRKRRLR